MNPALHLPIRPVVPDADKHPDGILGKGIIKVQHELPPEVARLARDLHDDRHDIVAGFTWALVLASIVVFLMLLATVRYLRCG